MNRRDRQAGFTLIEAICAAFIAIVAVGALTVLFVNADDTSLADQAQISQLSVLQRQIESVRQMVKQNGFGALALSGNPAQATDATLPADPADPNDFLTGWNTSGEAFLVEANYNSTAEGVIAGTPATGETLLDPLTGASGGLVAPVQYVDLTSWNAYDSAASVPSGDAYAIVNTYVTQATTGGCNTSLGSCAANDVRRVIIAAQIHNVGTHQAIGPNNPTYSSTVFVNPVPSNQPNTPSGLRLLGLIS